MAVNRGVLDNAIRSDLFTFHDNKFVAEASDLKMYRLDRQIYDDACDTGFAIESTKTNKKIKFFLSETKKDREGDIQFWKFIPCTEDARDPTVRQLQVIVFND